MVCFLSPDLSQCDIMTRAGENVHSRVCGDVEDEVDEGVLQ